MVVHLVAILGIYVQLYGLGLDIMVCDELMT